LAVSKVDWRGAAQGSELCGQLNNSALIDVSETDLTAHRCKTLRDGSANTTRCASDHHALIR
jgi:hypothetical protein